MSRNGFACSRKVKRRAVSGHSVMSCEGRDGKKDPERGKRHVPRCAKGKIVPLPEMCSLDEAGVGFKGRKKRRRVQRSAYGGCRRVFKKLEVLSALVLGKIESMMKELFKSNHRHPSSRPQSQSPCRNPGQSPIWAPGSAAQAQLSSSGSA
jgi:hypothetical protein